MASAMADTMAYALPSLEKSKVTFACNLLVKEHVLRCAFAKHYA